MKILRFINRLITTFFYFGYAPLMPGTIGALGGVLVYLIIIWIGVGAITYTIICAIFLIGGTIVAHYEEVLLNKKDASEIVIDEVSSILITMYMIPFSWMILLIGFVLNRIFDIIKPYPANRLQKIHGGDWYNGG